VEQINKQINEIRNRVENVRGYKKTEKYIKPKLPKLARFKLFVQFKNKGSYILPSWEHIDNKKTGLLNEEESLIKLMRFAVRIYKQHNLKDAKIYVNTDYDPRFEDKKYNDLVAIWCIKENKFKVNNTVSFIKESENKVLDLYNFVRKWIK
jgi:hypothetical protein|tara:strand:- start:19 stop:471 length:453 start_codon:yes stop_codon:yes gene_type:complete